MKFCVSIGSFLRDCNVVFKGVSDEDCQVCVCFILCVLCVVCDGHFALSSHRWFRPAIILLELDFLSLYLETSALRNTYLDHL